MKRLGISKKTRFDVFKRDGFRCQYCGAHPSENVLLEADHINPVAEGGSNDADNLVTACWDCNRGKGARLLTVVPQSLEDKAAETVEREAQIAAYSQVMQARRDRIEADVWAVASPYMTHFGDDGIRHDRFNSIKGFVDRLGVHRTLELMELSLGQRYGRDRLFRYFCGCCWKRIRAMDEET